MEKNKSLQVQTFHIHETSVTKGTDVEEAYYFWMSFSVS